MLGRASKVCANARSTATRGTLEHRLSAARFHMIDATGVDGLTRPETKTLAHGPFLEMLRTRGRERAIDWLADASLDVGQRGTVDLVRWFG